MSLDSLKECVKWKHLFFVLPLSIVIAVWTAYTINGWQIDETVEAHVSAIIEQKLGESAERIDKSAKLIEEAVKGLTITQNNNQQINLPLSEDELRDARQRDMLKDLGYFKEKDQK